MRDVGLHFGRGFKFRRLLLGGDLVVLAGGLL
jgi:hypothetical protein